MKYGEGAYNTFTYNPRSSRYTKETATSINFGSPGEFGFGYFGFGLFGVGGDIYEWPDYTAESISTIVYTVETAI